ncbi:hypothetical protein [Phaeocystidibacter marisrubri]|uniref:Lipoprotein n=1 Tax=Phaeocystidibacter marisrubri TaxID=1577780 RepID=A0A6L3ZD87_9FLAO|nr:hypothetical protein [Phaeocystidibacter marisrubri]KAB2815185.1 hypothetical protein F8C82_13895 [Phaeocystidibacter marisrubri]GGH70766.1 hypothetical protein GCM10011318_13110 [Phaeocystidibacter marisrubri]
MKIWAFALLSLLLGSCSSSEESDVEVTEESIDTVDGSMHPTLTSTEPHGLQSGFWVNVKYVRNLRSSKSPKRAQQSVDFSGIQVSEEGEPSMMIWNFHEGTPTYVKTYDGELGFFNSSTNSKPEYRASMQKDTLIIGSEKFTLLESAHEFQIVEKILFEGEYKNHGRRVTLSANGEIKGLDSLTHYSPLIDYYDVGLDVDMMELGTSRSLPKRFGFVFANDTLNIYSLKCLALENGDCMEQALDTLFLQLIRVEN